MHVKRFLFLKWALLSALFFPAAVFAQPTANFTADTTSGCSPFSLVVNFLNLSTGGATSYKWEFGDPGNGTSTLANPTFIYSSPGCYDVTLIATNALGSDTLTQTCFIQIFPQPTPGFTVDAAEGCVPFTVTFTDTSASNGGVISNVQWTLSDGSPGSGSNPSFTFNTPDTIGVVMTVTNSNGCQRTSVFPNVIRVYNAPVANFSVNANSACIAPLTVNFTNLTQANGATNPTYQWLFPGGTPASSNATTPPPITYNAPGQYDVTLIVGSANGCADTLFQPNLIGIGGVIADFTTTATQVCLGDTITFTNISTGGVSSIGWNFGEVAGINSTANTVSYVYSNPGLYTITLMANNSQCGDTVSQVNLIEILPVPTAAFSVDRTQDCQPGIPFVFTDLSVGAVSWSWNFGDNTTSNQQNPSHTYTTFGSFDVCLIVTNSSGCTDSICETISIAPPSAGYSRNPTEGCIPLNVQFTDVSTSPLDPIISWQWTFGPPAGAAPTTSNLQNPAVVFNNPGVYNVQLIITTQAGCTDTALNSAAVMAGTPPTADFTVSKDTVCINEDITFTSTFFNPDWDFLWDFQYEAPGNFAELDSAPTTIYPDTGLYSVALIIDNRGCRDTMILTDLVFVSPPRAEFTVSDSLICSLPDTVQFTDLSIGPADVYEWYVNGNLYSTAQTPPDLPILSIGTYFVSQIIENSLSGCRDTFTLAINAGNPFVDFTSNDLIGCKPHQVRFNSIASNVLTYQWKFVLPSPGISDSPLPNPLFTYQDTGFYSIRLVGIDQFGCRDTMQKNNYIQVVGPYANLSVNPAGGCPPLDVQFTDNTATTAATTPVAWTWDFGDGSPVSNQQNPSHMYISAGSYAVTLTVTDDMGCTDTQTFPDVVSVTFPTPGFVVPDDSTCAGNLVNFANTSVGVGLTYFWDFGDGVGTSTLMNPTYAYSDTGSYTVTLVATDQNGCTDTLIVPNAVFIEPFTANFGGDPITGICPPLNTQFTDSTVGNVVGWLWNFGDGFGISQLQNPAYVYFQPGQFDVTLIATHEDGCRDTLVRQNYVQLAGPNGSFTATPDRICLGDSICIQAVTAGASTATFDFRDGNVVVVSGLSGTTDTVSVCHTYSASGNYDPVVVLQDAQGCVFTLTSPDSVSVYALPVANILPSDTVGCLPFAVPFTDASVPGDSAITNWIWAFGDGDSAFVQNPSHTYLTSGSLTVSLTVIDQNGCAHDTTTSLTSLEGAIADFMASDTIGCSPIDITFTDLSTNATVTSWNWTFGDGNVTSGFANPVHTYINDGLFTVTLIIGDNLGCRDTLTKINYIELRHPEAQVYSTVTQGCNPLIVTFFADSSTSSSTIVGYEWCLRELTTNQQVCFNTTVDTLDIDFTEPGNYLMTVAITDDLGCADTSEAINLLIDPRLTPEPIVMRNVSVTSNNSVEISWEPYPGVDFVEYAVYRMNGANLILVGTITNQNTTTITESLASLDTRNNSYCYKVLVQNSCLEYSLANRTQEHCTIDLETNSGLDQIDLSWTPYVGYVVGQYEIYRANDYNPGSHIQIGTVPGNVLTFTDLEMFCRDSVSYRILAVGFASNNQRSYSDLSANAPRHNKPTLPTDMIYASVVADSLIEMEWAEYTGYLPGIYVLEKSVNGLSWDSIGTFNLNNRTYIDTAVQVDERSYFYRVFNIDQCGDKSVVGLYAKTILLNAQLDRNGKIPQLSWSHYEQWASGVLNYEIEVFNEQTGAWETVDIVGGGERRFADNLTQLNQAEYCYRVHASEVGGNGAESYSNEVCVIFGPDIFVPNAFSPNNDGNNDDFLVYLPNIANGELSIFNRWGQLLYRTSDLSAGWDGTYNGKPVPEGVYVFAVEGVGVDGTSVSRTGTVTLIR
ncbi:MAG: PKD domain-containing protein [Bacteroidia bacterium]|nr:PKD domain-containing protein [Bacteroidia bacterium]